jgi:hypothetical protein
MAGMVTVDELRELLIDAWRMGAPKRLVAAVDEGAVRA